MEKQNIGLSSSSQRNGIVKQVPILSEQLIATTLFIDEDTKTPMHVHDDKDEIHYIVKGHGYISLENTIQEVKEGDLVMVHKNEPHYIKTNSVKMIVLTISTIRNNHEPRNRKNMIH
jgi:quercetin dioxygenase-like cupin family protein